MKNHENLHVPFRYGNIEKISFAFESLNAGIVTFDLDAVTVSESLYIKLVIQSGALFHPVPRNYSVALTLRNVNTGHVVLENLRSGNITIAPRVDRYAPHSLHIALPASQQVTRLGARLWNPRLTLYVGPAHGGLIS